MTESVAVLDPSRTPVDTAPLRDDTNDERSVLMTFGELAVIANSEPAKVMADLLHKLAGNLSEEIGAMLGEKFRAYRTGNLASVMQKTSRILADAEALPATVPSRLLIPIMEASSIEDADVLQELWAGLLATASQDQDAVSPSFVEVLKQLTPYEAQDFESIVQESTMHAREVSLSTRTKIVPWAFSLNHYMYSVAKSSKIRKGVDPETYERLGLIAREYELKDSHQGDVRGELDSTHYFTGFGVEFWHACHGPLRRETDAPPPTSG